MNIALRWAVSAVALYITVTIASHLGLGLKVVAGLTGIEASLIAAVVFAIVNTVIRPIVQLLTLPLTCLTFGLFSFVVNALLFGLVLDLVPGFTLHGFLAPLFGSIVMGVISGALNTVLTTDKEKSR